MNPVDTDKKVDWDLFRTRIIKATNLSAPDFFGETQRFEVVSSEPLGTSDEPMRRVSYNIYKGEELQGRFIQTLVFNSNYDLQKIVSPSWAYQFSS